MMASKPKPNSEHDAPEEDMSLRRAVAFLFCVFLALLAPLAYLFWENGCG